MYTSYAIEQPLHLGSLIPSADRHYGIGFHEVGSDLRIRLDELRTGDEYRHLICADMTVLDPDWRVQQEAEVALRSDLRLTEGGTVPLFHPEMTQAGLIVVRESRIALGSLHVIRHSY